jgi:DNA repair and recombination protein RAD54B
VHPDTACHTHELLDCPCDASGAVDVQAVAATLAKEPTSDTEDESDDGERELVRTFQAASQLRPDDIEKMDKDVSTTI